MKNKKNLANILLFLGLVLLFITGNGKIGLIMIILSLVFYSQDNKNKISNIKEEARLYVENIKKLNKIPIVETSFYLPKDEKAFLEENVSLLESRSRRHYSGSGAGFRVAKGIRVGGYSGSSISRQEWHTLDKGKIVLTNKQIIFQGEKENRQIPIKKIFGFDITNDSISISSGKKNIMFKVQNPFIWSTAMNILQKVDNTDDLSKIDLDITIK